MGIELLNPKGLWLLTGLVPLIALYILTAVSVIVFFRRNRGLNGNPWTTLVIPAVSLVLLVITEWLMVSNFSLLVGTDQSEALLIAATCIVAFLIGLGLYGIRRSSLSADAMKDLESEVM